MSTGLHTSGIDGRSRTAYARAVSDFTRILDRVEQGDPQAAEESLPLVYDELRRQVAQKMTNAVPGQTRHPAALVHEAWLRLSWPEWTGPQRSSGAPVSGLPPMHRP